MGYVLFYVVLLMVLLGCSAFFSGSETALFSLSRNIVKTMRQSDHSLEHLAGRLLAKPEQLLGSLLLGNLIVNILFFAAASAFSVKLEQQSNTTAAAVAAFVSFILLILCGEILPKYLSYNNSRRISVVVALPVYLVVRFFSPVVTFFRKGFVEPALRVILGPARHPKPISADEFKALIATTYDKGLISLHQGKILTELMDFGLLTVRNVLLPRVDIVGCSVKGSVGEAGAIMMKHRLTKIPVYTDTIDDIVGMVEFRDIILNPESTLDKVTKKAHFVPEQKSVESLLEFFQEKSIDTAIVVDEYGGVAGLVCLDDIAEELIGSIGSEEEADLIEQLSESDYRLAGDLGLHDWCRRFDIRLEEDRMVTLGGFVASLLSKIPEKGDVASWANLTFRVEQVSRHRIRTILMTIGPGGGEQ
ncbi:MAG: HlyC/CorC family transporter [Sedimentisphaerales bacterium]|nr:HlyC/CorC family transporter [Sedimentisphaerales bacterium]